MKKIFKKIILTAILIVFAQTTLTTVYGETYKFDDNGQTKNPFCPRGYMVESEGSVNWISGPFNNSGELPIYTGSYTGLDYIEADQAGMLYALTDRNPTPGKNYLVGYKNGAVISGFSSCIGTPSRADIATSGASSGWKIPISMTWEPGCVYEFGFLRGMQANNGITLVFSEDGKGYIKSPSTSAEINKYNRDKYDEYEFIVSYEKNTDPETGDEKYFNFYMVPMRFTIRTYADISRWESASAEGSEFLSSITDHDLRTGKYKRSNVAALGQLIEDLNNRAETYVRKELQSQADASIDEMIWTLNDMIERTKTEKPEPADMSKLLETIEEAERLYEKASINTGIDIGQYGEYEVRLLSEEIDIAKGMDKYMLQTEIDSEVTALEAAILAVRKSLKMEEQLYFYDKATGIYVIAPITSLPEDAKLFVRRMDKESKEYQSIAGQLSDSETEAVYYNIQFYQDEFKIQPKENVEVQMPVDASISKASSTVYSVDDNGKLVRIDSVKTEDGHIFKTDNLTALVLAGSIATEEEKAAVRGEKMKEIISQTEDQKKDNKETELLKEKKKKEEFKDPLNKLLKRNANTATFSGDVRVKTDPGKLLYIAVLLAAAAILLGLRGISEMKRGRRNSKLL